MDNFKGVGPKSIEYLKSCVNNPTPIGKQNFAPILIHHGLLEHVGNARYLATEKGRQLTSGGDTKNDYLHRITGLGGDTDG